MPVIIFLIVKLFLRRLKSFRDVAQHLITSVTRSLTMFADIASYVAVDFQSYEQQTQAEVQSK